MMFTRCSDCCAQKKDGNNGGLVEFAPPAPLDPNSECMNSTIIGERTDRTRQVNLSEKTDRKWVRVQAYQPIDTVTKTVEIPVIKTVETYRPKIITEEKIIEVPKYIQEYVERKVEVEEVHWIEKEVEVPKIQYKIRYVPKIEYRQNNIEQPITSVKWVEKYVDVQYLREIRYLRDNMVNERIIKCSTNELMNDITMDREQWEIERRNIDENNNNSNNCNTNYIEDSVEYVNDEAINISEIKQMSMMQDMDNNEIKIMNQNCIDNDVKKMYHDISNQQMVNQQMVNQQMVNQQMVGQQMVNQQMCHQQYVGEYTNYPMQQPNQISPQYMSMNNQQVRYGDHPQVEQLFVPKVHQQVEIQKQVPVSIDVPVPYMVPKPTIIPVEVPVLRFRDHFHPVPVRRRVIPKITWTNEVYEVECLRDKPYLQIQDVIKPVPCDVEIGISEYVHTAQPINPTELSQADIHAMWMRSNADLADQKKREYGDKYPHIKHEAGTVFGQPGDNAPPCAQDMNGQDPISLHPGHPLGITYLQNQWLKNDTTKTHQMYSPEWFEAHQHALHNVQMQNPSQIQLTPEQAQQLQQGFCDNQYDEQGSDPGYQANYQQPQYGNEVGNGGENACGNGGGYEQGSYEQGSYEQGGYEQGGYEQAGYEQGGYDQPCYDQPGYDQQFQYSDNQPNYEEQNDTENTICEDQNKSD